MIQSSVKSGFRMYVRCEVCDGTYTSHVKLLMHGAHTLATPGLVELNTALPDPPSCFKLRAQCRRFLARRRLVVGSPPAFEGPPQAKLLAPAASSAKSASCNPSSPKQN